MMDKMLFLAVMKFFGDCDFYLEKSSTIIANSALI